MSKIKWSCPQCGSEPGKHGKGGRENCINKEAGSICAGFNCECEDDGGRDHGTTLKTACPQAACYHCGWGGSFPTRSHLKKQNLIPCPHCKGTGAVKGTS